MVQNEVSAKKKFTRPWRQRPVPRFRRFRQSASHSASKSFRCGRNGLGTFPNQASICNSVDFVFFSFLFLFYCLVVDLQQQMWRKKNRAPIHRTHTHTNCEPATPTLFAHGVHKAKKKLWNHVTHSWETQEKCELRKKNKKRKCETCAAVDKIQRKRGEEN